MEQGGRQAWFPLLSSCFIFMSLAIGVRVSPYIVYCMQAFQCVLSFWTDWPCHHCQGYDSICLHELLFDLFRLLHLLWWRERVTKCGGKLCHTLSGIGVLQYYFFTIVQYTTTRRYITGNLRSRCYYQMSKIIWQACSGKQTSLVISDKYIYSYPRILVRRIHYH